MTEDDDVQSSDRLCDSTINHRFSVRTTSFIVRFMLLLTHACFLFGQIAVMWYLFSEIRADVTLHADSPQAKVAFRLLHFHNPSNFTLKFHQTIEEFTYWDAIKGLYTGRSGPVDPKLENPPPGAWGKVSAILLVFFSAIWPHAKLLGLNYQYHRRVKFGQEESRTTTLYWLDTFGKWSLADVFVIGTLLAVLNMDIPINGEKLLQALSLELERISKEFTKASEVKEVSRAVCQQLFYYKQPCDFPSTIGDCRDLQDACPRCACLLENTFPETSLLLYSVGHLLRGVSAAGDIIATLRVAGRPGIYVFCLSTLMSLSLSWLIDVIDHRTRSKRKMRARTLEQDMFFNAINEARSMDVAKLNLIGRGQRIASIIENTDAAFAEEHNEHQLATSPMLNSSVRNIRPAKWITFFSVLGIIATILSVFAPMIRRKVPGSIMDIAREDLDVQLEKEFSIFNLVELTGVAGGPDYLVMLTFGMFLIVGPIVRSLVVCIVTFVPLPPRTQKKLAFATSTLGVLSGWDVLLVAFVLVSIEMPRISQGIISPSLSVCRLLHQLGSEPYCLSIEFLFIAPQFILLPLAFFLIVFSAARVTRVAFFAFDPFGDGYTGAPQWVSALVG